MTTRLEILAADMERAALEYLAACTAFAARVVELTPSSALAHGPSLEELSSPVAAVARGSAREAAGLGVDIERATAVRNLRALPYRERMRVADGVRQGYARIAVAHAQATESERATARERKGGDER